MGLGYMFAHVESCTVHEPMEKRGRNARHGYAAAYGTFTSCFLQHSVAPNPSLEALASTIQDKNGLATISSRSTLERRPFLDLVDTTKVDRA